MTTSSTTSDRRVPFLDLQAAYAELKNEIDSAVQRVLSRGWYILGEEVAAFEREFAAYCGAGHCIGVSNGLDALQLVLRAWDVGPGDEVIVPSHTFIATWLAVSYTGATPVPVEPRAGTYNLDPERLEAAITPRTKAIIPVHLYGQTAEMEAIMEIARRRGVRVLEDAAQAQGATFAGRRAGALGDAAAFSFYPGKNLGAAGDAGAITTDDDAVAARIRAMANYGSRAKYVHDEKGFNCRLDEIQAAVLRAKLPHLESWNARRRTIAQLYTRELAGVPGIVLPRVADRCEPVWHLYVVQCDGRDAVQKRLADAGVATLIHYPVPPYLQGAYSGMASLAPAFPLATSLATRVLSLPMGPHLTAADAAYVASAVAGAAAR